MATATERPATRDEKVYHPLDRLRGIIRRYVVIEGVLATLIFLGTWFALALLLDYVVFKTFTWDWVQDGSWWFRFVGLVAALVRPRGHPGLPHRPAADRPSSPIPRSRSCSNGAIPKVLGDRLITAVEMADVDQAAKYGYSADMIRQTITEARERVGTVDVHAVFNWRRLRLMALLAVGIPLAIVAIAFAAHAISARDVQPARAAWKLYHVSTIVGERDLLLWDTPWPRRALLDLQGDAREGLRVARDGSPPRVRVKSYQWVVVDRSHPDGWRPLMWNEVNESLVGMPVPAVPFRSLGYQNEPNIRSVGLAAVAGSAGMESAPDENPEFSTSAADWTVDAIYERAHAGDSRGFAGTGRHGSRRKSHDSGREWGQRISSNSRTYSPSSMPWPMTRPTAAVSASSTSPRRCRSRTRASRPPAAAPSSPRATANTPAKSPA